MPSPVIWSAFIGIFLTVFSAHAKERPQHSQVEVFFEKMIAAPGETVTLAWVIRPDSGWHIYWKNPGNSGSPPEVRWVGIPQGTAISELEFPVPDRIPYRGLVNYGYSSETWFFQKFTLPKTATTGTLNFHGDAKWLICKDECLPAKASLKAEISLGTHQATYVGQDPQAESAKRSDRAARWMKAVDRFPKAGAESFGLQIGARLAETPSRAFIVLTVRDSMQDRQLTQQFAQPYFFPLLANVDSKAMQKHRIHVDGFSELWIPFKKPSVPGPFSIDGIYTFSMEGRSGFRFQTNVSETASLSEEEFQKLELVDSVPPSAHEGGDGLFLMLFFSFLGGLILNLMPCVLPVLSIKLISVFETAQASPKETRRETWAYFLGILSTFWLIATVGIALKAAGQSVGWGFQLQSPIFVGVLALVFFGMALNLWGVFEMTFSTLGRVSGIRGVGSFLSGFLTVVAATPCSAPFMTTALGYALTQPNWVLFLILTFLGLGLALPFLLVAGFPRLKGFIPKPGRWMLTFKKAMAVPLLGTAVWLGWVLDSQAGRMAVFHLASLGALVFGLAFSVGRSQRHPGRHVKNVVAAAAGLLVFVATFIFLGAPTSVPNKGAIATAPNTGLSWKKFSEKDVEAARAQGRPVFVDFTADWCVTCHVNESLVLETEPVRQAFAAAGVELFRADWTNADPEITSALEKVGRNSVPVYLWYPPDTLRPEILPQILSQGMLLSRVKPLNRD
ncbi:MAG: thioredoxin family protein [Bdellovibrionales bacterium]|nr:thioredoxin family protein [Bdellovibrionales bacterium]